MDNEEKLRSFIDKSTLHDLNKNLIFDALSEHLLPNEDLFLYRDTYADSVSGILVATSRKLIHANVSTAFLSSDVDIKSMPFREIQSIEGDDDEITINLGSETLEYPSFGGSKSVSVLVDLVKDYI